MTSLVGRASELAGAHRLLDAASGGTGGLLILRGEAGIGKSRLVRELLRTAADRGFAVRNAEASVLDQTRPFGACADALTVAARPGNAGQAGLARRIHGHPGWSGRIEDVPVEVHRLVDDLIGVFEELCAATPLLLVIDNLHWLDNSSLLLRRLAAICHQYPALILLTTHLRGTHGRSVQPADLGSGKTVMVLVMVMVDLEGYSANNPSHITKGTRQLERQRARNRRHV